MKIRNALGLGLTAGLLGLVCGLGNANSTQRPDSNKPADVGKPITSVKLYDYRTGEPFEFERYNVPKIGEEKPFSFRPGPIYSEKQVPPLHCSRYVRLAANDLFGIKYPEDNAWNIRNYQGVSEIVVNGTPLEELVANGKLKPGMIIGVAINHPSRYDASAERSGAGYTHAILYLGMDKNEELCFADQWGTRTRPKISLDDLKRSGTPKEILYIKTN